MKVVEIIMVCLLFLSCAMLLAYAVVSRKGDKEIKKLEEEKAMHNRAQAESELEKERYAFRSKDMDLKYESAVRDRAMYKARLAETVSNMNDDQRRDFIFMLQIKSGQLNEHVRNLNEQLVYEQIKNNALASSATWRRSIYGGW